MADSHRDPKRTSGPADKSRAVDESALAEPGRTPGSAEGERGAAGSSAQGEPGRTAGSAEGSREIVEAALDEIEHNHNRSGHVQSRDKEHLLPSTKTIFTRNEAETLHAQGTEAVFVVLESLSQEIVQLRSQLKELRQRMMDKR